MDNGKLQRLGWLIEGIEESIAQAFASLEVYINDPSRKDHLEQCTVQLQQVLGTLQFAECRGGTILAEEILQLLAAVQEEQVANQNDAHEVLVDAAIKLPVYIKQIVQSGKDQPETLIGLLNDLRTVRNKPLFSESSLFSPDFKSHQQQAQPGPSPAADNDRFKSLIKKLRQMYQMALLGVIRESGRDANFVYIEKVFSRLISASKGTVQYRLWQIAQALQEGLRTNTIVLSISVRMLLKSLDRELRKMEKSGISALDHPPAEALLKNMLYYVTTAYSDSRRIVEIKALYQLNQALPAGSYGGVGLIQVSDSEAVSALAQALLGVMVSARDLLTTYYDEGCVDFSRLEQLNDVVTHMKDSFSFVGKEGQLPSLQQLMVRLDGIVAERTELDNTSIAELAGQLMDVEASIVEWSKDCSVEVVNVNYFDAELGSARDVVLAESIKSLSDIKNSISEYVASHWDPHFLSSVPEKLAGVCGVLAMLDLQRPLLVLEAVAEYIEDKLLVDDEAPEWRVMEQLADVLTGVEGFMLVAQQSESSEAEVMLSLAETTIQELGANTADADAVSSDEFFTDMDLDDFALPGGNDFAFSSGDDLPPAPDGATGEPDTIAEKEDDVDDEIREIFVEEATDVLSQLHGFVPALDSAQLAVQDITEVRRAFHTLKGSGRMVSAGLLAELAWAVEQLLNEVVENRRELTTEMMAVIAESIAVLPDLISAFECRRCYEDLAQIESLTARINNLAGFGKELSGEDYSLTEDLNIDAMAVDAFSTPDLSLDEMGEDETVSDYTVVPEPETDSQDEERELREIFVGEAGELLLQVEEFIVAAKEQAPHYPVPNKPLLRALHTLRGSATVADMTAASGIIAPLESLVIELADYQMAVDDNVVSILEAVCRALASLLPELSEQGHAQIANSDHLVSAITAIYQDRIEPLHANLSRGVDAEQANSSRLELTALMGSGLALTMALSDQLDAWRNEPDYRPDLSGLNEEMQKLEHVAVLADVSLLSELGRLLGAVFSELDTQHKLTAADIDFDLLGDALEELLDQMDNFVASQEVDNLEPLLGRLQDFLDTLQVTAESVVDTDEDSLGKVSGQPEPIESAEESTGDRNQVSGEPSVEIQPTPVISGSQIVSYDDEGDQEGLDMEIVEIFLEEANELLETVDTAIHRWQENPASADPVEEIKRALHTFKGGSRMAGLMSLGECSHQFETMVVNAQAANKIDEDFFRLLGQHQDQLLDMVDRVRNLPAGTDEPSGAAESIMADSGAADLRIELNQATPFASDELDEAAQQYVPQEVVKVPAKVLDDLVNMAGESSISRARIEQQVSDFSFALDEMGTTVFRLQEQVRRLGSETDAQIAFRQEQLEALGEGEFDPLEMDRYSTLQQLSRSLLESVSDIHDLKNTLVLRTKDSSTLLTQQGRINTELQKSLMRSRMIPFSRMVPRLRRIVRQISGELNKKVNLELINIEGEMDRSILEGMVPALEHMLRNAIDHGIESVQHRQAQGKPEAGLITINLLREGGDILIRLTDDGSGLDLDAIREKAIRQQLLPDDIELNEMQIIQCVLRPGFSTADEVSQISGRGVGLDVVNSDVREMGGSISIRTKAGVGTELQIRLPFTVSINRALMIESGDDIYALPMSSIGGVIRMRPDELAGYYRNPEKLYKYSNKEYPVRYLGSLLNESVPPRISSAEESIPLVLVNSEEQSFAVQVDRLGGSSEVVVKTLTRPFSTVPGLSGATVLGDGRVVVILDLLALLRSQKGQPRTDVQWLEDASAATVEAAVPTVMVVDDSVTVRKVTSRFLAREGFNVLTAKDGADAMRLLRDHDPDVMLLDIEMPRMDGFEVASRLRSMSRFENLPIIMITSRTGDKHRQRAKTLGVNDYLGKPYHEEELLSAMQKLLAESEAKKIMA